MLVRADVAKEAGLWEDFFIHFDDVDWCYRLYKNTDYKIFLCTSTKVIHHLGASVNTLGSRKKVEFYIRV